MFLFEEEAVEKTRRNPSRDDGGAIVVNKQVVLELIVDHLVYVLPDMRAVSISFKVCCCCAV